MIFWSFYLEHAYAYEKSHKLLNEKSDTCKIIEPNNSISPINSSVRSAVED